MAHHGAVTTFAVAPSAPLAPWRVRVGLFAALTVLAASNVVSNRLWPQGYLAWNLAMTGVLLLVARAAGLTRADLGLGGERLRRGLVLGARGGGGRRAALRDGRARCRRPAPPSSTRAAPCP